MDKQQQQPKKIMSGKHRFRFLKKEMGRGSVGNIYKNKRLAWFKSRNPTICEEILSPAIAMDGRMAMDFSLQAQARSSFLRPATACCHY